MKLVLVIVKQFLFITFLELLTNIPQQSYFYEEIKNTFGQRSINFFQALRYLLNNAAKYF